MNILLVETDANIKRALDAALQARGHQVAICEDNTAAWQHCLQHAPSLVIIGGVVASKALALCRRLRSEMPGAALVLAVVRPGDDAGAFLDAGAGDLLFAPLNPADVAGRIAVAETWVQRMRDQRWRDVRYDLLTMLMDQCSDAVFIIDPDSAALLDANQQACDTLGYTRSQLLKLTIIGIDRTFADKKGWRQHVSHLRDTGSCIQQGYHRCRDGSLMKVETRFKYIEQDGQFFVVAFAHDLTQRSEIESELSSTRLRLQHLLNTSPGIIYSCVAGGDFAINYVSDNITHYLGYEPAEPLADPDFWPTHIHPDDKTRVFDDLPHLFETGHHAHEYRFRAKDGSYRWIYDEMQLVRDADGNPVEIVGYANEITDRKQAEQELIAAKEAAEEANKAKADFLAVVTHELRTPLNAISGFSDILIHGTSMDDEQKAYVEHVAKAAYVLDGLINDILDYSKMEAGNPALVSVPFDLELCIHEAMDMLSADAEQKGLEFAVHYFPDAPRHFMGDPNRLRQIVINLASNALKFTERGHVLVKIDVETRVDDKTWMSIEVEDSGIGIPGDQLERIFERFTQVDSSLSRRFGGVGLGLAIVSVLVEVMGGEISVESRLGDGSRFRVRLPMTEDTHLFGPARDPYILAGQRVLVVGDRPLTTAILQQHIESWGGRSVSASSGTESLQILRAAAREGDSIRFVIVPENLRDMDAADLGSVINADSLLQDILVIKICAADRACRLDLLEQAGISACLVRPINPAHLRETLMTLSQAWKREQGGACC